MQKTIAKIIIIGIMTVVNGFALNELQISNPRIYAGNKISVDLILLNQDTIAGLQIPIYWGDNNILIDSISYLGSRCGIFAIRYLEKFENQASAFILLISNAMPEDEIAPLLPGSGLICRVYLHYHVSLKDKIIRFERGNIRNEIRDLKFIIWTSLGAEIHGSILSYQFRVNR